MSDDVVPQPLTLAIDTAAPRLQLALLRCDGRVDTLVEDIAKGHAELLFARVDTLLTRNGVIYAQLQRIATTTGPGSFTGLRIACAVTQGLAFGADLPVAGISTLESLAEQTEGDRVLTLLDARMAEVYWAAYERADGGWQAVVEPRLALPESVYVPDGDGWIGAGNGFAVLGDALRAPIVARLGRIETERMPDAAAMAPLAAQAFARGAGRDAAEAAPIYLRDKVALTVDERRARRSA